MTIKKRTSIPSEEKKKLVSRITLMKLEGHSNQSIADELAMCWNTVDKYWREVLATTGDIDPLQLLKERRLMTERLLNKSLRDHYDGLATAKDVLAIMATADRYNGLDRYLESKTETKLPPLLEIVVQTVELELPHQ